MIIYNTQLIINNCSCTCLLLIAMNLALEYSHPPYKPNYGAASSTPTSLCQERQGMAEVELNKEEELHEITR